MGYRSGKRAKSKQLTDAYIRGEHVMSKPEAKVMRRLQAETGLSEEEIRSVKKYRKMLSDAQGRKSHAKPAEQTWTIDYKCRFRQRVGVFIKDDSVIDELYKRHAGGMMGADDRRPKDFHYATIPVGGTDAHRALQTIHDQTDGRYYYDPAAREVGFQYEENLTMFLLALQVQA